MYGQKKRPHRICFCGSAAVSGGIEHRPAECGLTGTEMKEHMKEKTSFEEPSYELELPQELKGKYRVCSCLRSEESSATYLLTETDSGPQMIFKTTAEDADPDQVYHFAEPMIEEAVRRQLQVWDRDLTLGDLARITSIHIMGLEIYADDSYLWLRGDTPMFYDEWTQESGKFLQSGPISSLEDIVHMPSLHTLCLYNQNIDDISLLKDTRISYLGLGYNPLTDFSPLENNPSIRTLMIPDLPITNLASISTLPNLNELNISGCGGITSIEELAGGPVVILDLSLIELTDYSQLRDMPNLYSLFLKRLDSNILSELNGLPLTSLTFYYSHNLKLEDIQGLENLEYLGIWGDGESMFEMGENNNLPRVWHIALAGMKIDDFSDLEAIPNLTRLEIHGADVINYKGLDRLPRLNNIVCSPEQREEIDRVYPDNEFLF